ncbi:hypothetical protein H4Q26_015497 [Puccinia striiformis f. sp. tritici PST-130]|nr:hypothetical protein H4Q26_015497 [Puccinia striiformis f. sp. tritici PST-130]
MFIMNIFQRAYLTFAFLALFITLHPDQVEAVEIVKKECTYHFNRVGAVPGRACEFRMRTLLLLDQATARLFVQTLFHLHVTQIAIISEFYTDICLMFYPLWPSKTGMAPGGTVRTTSRAPQRSVSRLHRLLLRTTKTLGNARFTTSPAPKNHP